MSRRTFSHTLRCKNKECWAWDDKGGKVRAKSQLTCTQDQLGREIAVWTKIATRADQHPKPLYFIPGTVERNKRSRAYPLWAIPEMKRGEEKEKEKSAELRRDERKERYEELRQRNDDRHERRMTKDWFSAHPLRQCQNASDMDATTP